MCLCVANGRPDTIAAAIHVGGASRVSGAFTAHREPRLVSYLANCQMPIELGATDKLASLTEDVATFAGSVVRLLLDSDVKVTFCSFRASMVNYSRSEQLLEIAAKCNLTIAELLKIMSNGFAYNFQDVSVRREMVQRFWADSIGYLEPLGFRYFNKKSYFPPPAIQSSSSVV